MTAQISKTASIVVISMVVLGGVGFGGFWLGAQQSPKPEAATAEGSALYWYDPMVPDQHFDKPGKSPFMDMQLVPRYAGDTAGSTSVQINPSVVQNLGVRLTQVERSEASETVRASGTLAYNGREIAAVQAKQDGFVERDRGLAVGDIVKAGDAIVDLRVPAWTAALAEYLSLRESPDTLLAQAARKRLGMLGLPADAIAAAERSSTAPVVFTVRAPIAGALVALDARQGMSLSGGAPIASITGLSPVWLVVSVPQGSVGGLAAGDAASATFPAFPGKQFDGRVEVILPGANATNRTVEVRIALTNFDGRLRPGMTGDVTFTGAVSRQALTVPSEAVIRTGQRTVVIVARDDGGFEPTDVTLGAAAGDRLEVVSGLSEGQSVVASGQFLIDSEANLTGVLERLRGASAAMAMTDYEATGKVTAIDGSGVTLAHSPVPQLSWPEMTMAFGWGDLAHDVAIGDEVTFSFRKGGAGYVLTSIRKTGAPR
jgi:Cu(I)/Ag(I) efflux system membrane fusion protein